MKLRVKAGHRYDQGLRRYLPGEEVEVEDRFVRILTSEKCPLEHIPAPAEAKTPTVTKGGQKAGNKRAVAPAPTPVEPPPTPPAEPQAAVPAENAPPTEPPQSDMLAGTYGRRDMRAED